MAFAGSPPWHGLGQKVPPHVDAAEMIAAAGLAWRVSKRAAAGARAVASRDGQHQFDRYVVVRDRLDDEQEEPILGLVRASYEPLQNIEAFDFFAPLIRSGFATFETAGALYNGERVWVQVRVGGRIEVVPGDEIEQYLLLANSHNGRGAVSVRFTPIRVVCQNTLNLATRDGESVHRVRSVRHSKHMRDRLNDHQVEFLMRLISATFTRAANQFRGLAGRTVSPQDHERYLEALFPRAKGTLTAPRSWRRIDDVLSDEKVTPGTTRNTWWALYNAVVRVEDYRPTNESSEDARLDRVWFGRGADRKIAALGTALALSGVE